jgi:hypothetical protein
MQANSNFLRSEIRSRQPPPPPPPLDGEFAEVSIKTFSLAPQNEMTDERASQRAKNKTNFILMHLHFKQNRPQLAVCFQKRPNIRSTIPPFPLFAQRPQRLVIGRAVKLCPQGRRTG